MARKRGQGGSGKVSLGRVIGAKERPLSPPLAPLPPISHGGQGLADSERAVSPQMLKT